MLVNYNDTIYPFAQPVIPPFPTPPLSAHFRLHEDAMAAYTSLMNGLQGEPILILFGSDGGNAHTVAKHLASEARRRGLSPR